MKCRDEIVLEELDAENLPSDKKLVVVVLYFRIIHFNDISYFILFMSLLTEVPDISRAESTHLKIVIFD